MKRLAFLSVLLATITTLACAGSLEEKEEEASLSLASVRIKPDQSIHGFQVYYLANSPGLVKVKIFNQAGHLIFLDYINKKQGWIKRYQLDLNDEIYKVKVEDQNSVYSKYIVKQNNAVEVLDAQKISLFKSAENKVRLIVTGSDICPVSVKIYDSKNNVIYKENINNEHSFSRDYNIKELMSKKVTFEVNNKVNYLVRNF